MSDQNKVSITNPLQTNNTVVMMLAYGAGVLASKFPLFDSATWQAILLAAGGLIFTVYTAIVNRKTAVVSTVANMPEVSKVEMEKTPSGLAMAQSDNTPNNVTVAK
jgi:hypothetical protein